VVLLPSAVAALLACQPLVEIGPNSCRLPFQGTADVPGRRRCDRRHRDHRHRWCRPAVVALQLSSTQFSPRLLRNFLRDRPNQIVLSLFVATFTYSAAGLYTVGVSSGERTTDYPRLAVSGAILLLFASLATVVLFADHLAHSIQIDAITRTVERRALAVVRSAPGHGRSRRHKLGGADPVNLPAIRAPRIPTSSFQRLRRAARRRPRWPGVGGRFATDPEPFRRGLGAAAIGRRMFEQTPPVTASGRPVARRCPRRSTTCTGCPGDRPPERDLRRAGGAATGANARDPAITGDRAGPSVGEHRRRCGLRAVRPRNQSTRWRRQAASCCAEVGHLIRPGDRDRAEAELILRTRSRIAQPHDVGGEARLHESVRACWRLGRLDRG
jgi:hypothetical protein